jgi:predicted nucleotidyltransferase component of viral defense system
MVTQLQQSGAFEPSEREPDGQPKPPPPLKPEQQEALVRANSLVDRVLSTGKLTMQDTHEIRRELAQLKSREEAEEVRRRIIVALNKNQLALPEGPEALP